MFYLRALKLHAGNEPEIADNAHGLCCAFLFFAFILYVRRALFTMAGKSKYSYQE